MTTAKNKVFIGLQHENCYLVEGELTFGGGWSPLEGFFQVGDDFPASGGGLPLIPPVGKTLIEGRG